VRLSERSTAACCLEDGGLDGIVVDTEAGRRFVDAPERRSRN
jgi:hypothetical protein